MRPVVINVLMDIPADHRFHRATLAALDHAADVRVHPIDVRVVPTDTIHDFAGLAAGSSAIVIGPGSPYRDPEAALAMVREARERRIPLVGT
jgi:CTP synthase (UTP-ammonia lyase)